MVGLVVYIRDAAAGIEWSGSAKTRNIKKQIDRLLVAAALEHDAIETPSLSKH